jgi:hypothetical protein
MKNLMERLRAEAQARPVRFMAALLVAVIIVSFWFTMVA